MLDKPTQFFEATLTGSFHGVRIPSVTSRWSCSKTDTSNCCSRETLFPEATCGFRRRDAVDFALHSGVGKQNGRPDKLIAMDTRPGVHRGTGRTGGGPSRCAAAWCRCTENGNRDHAGVPVACGVDPCRSSVRAPRGRTGSARRHQSSARSLRRLAAHGALRLLSEGGLSAHQSNRARGRRPRDQGT